MTLIAVTALSLDLAAHVKNASKLANLEAKLVYLRGEVDFLRTRLDDGFEYYHEDEETYYDEGEDEVRYSPSFYNQSPKLGGLGSVNLLLFFRSPSPVQAEGKNEINKFSRTLTTRFRTLFITKFEEPSQI